MNEDQMHAAFPAQSPPQFAEMVKETLRTPDGAALAGTSWRLPSPRAVVLVCHGYGEHSGRYGHVVNALTTNGYAVFTMDHRGHGRSSGGRTVIRDFDTFVADFHLLADRARDAYPDLPHILLGHSMGGLIAVRYTLRYQPELAALITSGPAVMIPGELPAPLFRLLAPLGRIAPWLPVQRGAEDVLSSDEGADEEFAADHRNFAGPVLAGIGAGMQGAAMDVRQHLDEITLPLLAMHGAEDRLTDPKGTVLLYEKSRSDDKMVVVWPGQKHEIFNDADRHKIIAFTLDWLNTRFPPR